MGVLNSVKNHAKLTKARMTSTSGGGVDIRKSSEWPYPEPESQDHANVTDPALAAHILPPPDHESAQPAAAAVDGKSFPNGGNRNGDGNAVDPSHLSTRPPSPARSGKSIRSTKSATSIKSVEPTIVNGVPSLDISIQFVGAKGLPRTDPVGGGSDPYFKAHLDDNISYFSTAQEGTMSPIWNEIWHVKNVPTSARLHVHCYDKDDGLLPDDYIGSYEIPIMPLGLREAEITGRLGKQHGTFYLNITATPVQDTTTPPYTFAGPCHYSRHRSPTVGALTSKETDDRLYATWKVYLVGIRDAFGDKYQHWNQDYPAAQKIFGKNAVSLTIRGTIHAGHKMLYARSTANAFGILSNAKDFVTLFKDESRDSRVKPAMYTYIINDDTWRFSETGAAFFVDFASKHALHANCAEHVRYSGEFHLRPSVPGGWAGYDDQIGDDNVDWELWIDNNSGTYAPDKDVLPCVQKAMELNFPGLKVVTHDHGDPELKESKAGLHKFAEERRGINASEFVAHPKFGETTLMNLAAKLKAHHADKEDKRFDDEV